MSLPAPPDGMPATVAHDGVVWTPRPATGNLTVAGAATAGLVGGPTAALLFWATLSPWGGAVGAVAGLGAAGAMVAANLRRRTLRVRRDRLVVEERGLFGRTRHELLFRELLTARRQRSHADHVPDTLLLRTADTTIEMGGGAPAFHIDWVVQAIDDALERFAAREKAEGREFFFHRKKPEALERLEGRRD